MDPHSSRGYTGSEFYNCQDCFTHSSSLLVWCLLYPLQFLVPVIYQGSSLSNSFCTYPFCSKQSVPWFCQYALMTLLLSYPSSPFLATMTWLRHLASFIWMLTQLHIHIHPIAIYPPWVAIAVFLNCSFYHPSCSKTFIGCPSPAKKVPPFTLVFEISAILPNLPFQSCLPLLFLCSGH